MTSVHRAARRRAAREKARLAGKTPMQRMMEKYGSRTPNRASRRLGFVAQRRLNRRARRWAAWNDVTRHPAITRRTDREL